MMSLHLIKINVNGYEILLITMGIILTGVAV